ncbi:MAG: hypothetical protein ACD_7C00441G0001 [uncultured bacterium]|nr:MAG: hypothetical protein ACD_7C00441G0001 [uncultured bacterium]
MLFIQVEIDGEITIFTNDLKEFCKNLKKGVYMVVYVGGRICDCTLGYEKSMEIEELIVKSKSTVVGYFPCGDSDYLAGKKFFNPEVFRLNAREVGPLSDEDVLSGVALMIPR